VTYQFKVTQSYFVSMLPTFFVSIYFGKGDEIKLLFPDNDKHDHTLHKSLTLRTKP